MFTFAISSHDEFLVFYMYLALRGNGSADFDEIWQAGPAGLPQAQECVWEKTKWLIFVWNIFDSMRTQ